MPIHTSPHACFPGFYVDGDSQMSDSVPEGPASGFGLRCSHCGYWSVIEHDNGGLPAYWSVIDGHSLCPDCCISCSECGETFRSDDIIYRESRDAYYCEACDPGEDTPTCPECGDPVEDDGALCDYCYERRERRAAGHILSAHSKPCLDPLGRDPHRYGLEIEVECANRGASASRIADQLWPTFNDLGHWAIIKSDGSLSNGFEICTRPASLDVHQSIWPTWFDVADLTDLRSFRTDTCGLHVHCSRRPLSRLTIGRMLCFVTAPRHRKFMERLAGRREASWCRYYDKKLTDVTKPESRYEALNLTNRDTVEFRIFRGTLKLASILKAIEFADALIRFAASTGGRSALDWESPADGPLGSDLIGGLCGYVRVNRKVYPHLWGFLSARWLGYATPESVQFAYPVAADRVNLSTEYQRGEC